MYYPLLALCAALMVVLFRTHCIQSGRIFINPVFGFLVGAAFYVLLPCTVIAYFGEDLAEITVYDNYLTLRNATSVMAFTLGILIAVFAGTRLVRRSPRSARDVANHRSAPTQSNDTGAAVFLMFGAYALFLLLTFSIREFLFVGYDESALGSDALWSARGAMSSSYSLICVSICAIVVTRRSSMSAAMLRTMVFIFLSASLVLLSLGARLYVAMALVSLLAMHSFLRSGIRTARLISYLLIGAVLFGGVGVLRSSSLDGLASVLLNIALEPLLTSISLFTLITDNPTILLGKPHMFPAEFQAILPSFLFPDKAGLFDRLGEYGYVFEAPVGGYHLYFSALINFGILGSLLLAIPCGYALAHLSRRRHVTRRTTILASIFLTGALTFTVFRDPFFISLVKNVFVMAILVPRVITFVSPYRSARPLAASANAATRHAG
jgi:oligosaccharide repeat unit polymerase